MEVAILTRQQQQHGTAKLMITWSESRSSQTQQLHMVSSTLPLAETRTPLRPLAREFQKLGDPGECSLYELDTLAGIAAASAAAFWCICCLSPLFKDLLKPNNVADLVRLLWMIHG
uniref:Uncharacterized protein n=1 Tax=Salix viminalis TaxID=40686 RepID=A0A6N2LC93_SALVM